MEWVLCVSGSALSAAFGAAAASLVGWQSRQAQDINKLQMQLMEMRLSQISSKEKEAPQPQLTPLPPPPSWDMRRQTSFRDGQGAAPPLPPQGQAQGHGQLDLVGAFAGSLPQAHAPNYMEQDFELLPAGWQGFSMEEARAYAAAGAEESREKTPGQVLADLQRGNARFWTGMSSRQEQSAFERRTLMVQQFPNSAVLGCADSRVAVETVFDQGLGDMFVVRVAGNCLDVSSLGSLQYAIFHIKVKVLMVLGHEGCGAIKAAALPLEKIEEEPEALREMLKAMKRGLDDGLLQKVTDSRARDREAVVSNVRRQVERLTGDPRIMDLVQEGELKIVGAFYEISSGIVDFFLEVDVLSIVNDSDSELDASKEPSQGVHERLAVKLRKRPLRLLSTFSIRGEVEEGEEEDEDEEEGDEAALPTTPTTVKPPSVLTIPTVRVHKPKDDKTQQRTNDNQSAASEPESSAAVQKLQRMWRARQAEQERTQEREEAAKRLATAWRKMKHGKLPTKLPPKSSSSLSGVTGMQLAAEVRRYMDIQQRGPVLPKGQQRPLPGQGASSLDMMFTP